MWAIEQGDYRGQFETWDRGAQFGDGLFETILVKNCAPTLLPLHINRLEKGLERLSINVEGVDFESLVVSAVKELCEHSKLNNGVYKLIVNRGSSSRGYGYSSDIKPNITSLFSPLPEVDTNKYKDGIALKFCKTHCAIQPELAGLKHLNRLDSVLAKQELSGMFEGLMFNYLGFAIEGTMSNVFFEKNDQLYTPLLNLSGVDGVMRTLVLEDAKRNNIPIEVTNITRENLDSFESGFICNSIFGILPINQLGGRTFVTGPITKKIQNINTAEIFE